MQVLRFRFWSPLMVSSFFQCGYGKPTRLHQMKLVWSISSFTFFTLCVCERACERESLRWGVVVPAANFHCSLDCVAEGRRVFEKLNNVKPPNLLLSSHWSSLFSWWNLNRVDDAFTSTTFFSSELPNTGPTLYGLLLCFLNLVSW